MKLKHFNLKIVSKNGHSIYKVEGYPKLTIIETKSINAEFYKLSTKEVLNVLDHFKVLKKLKQIKIIHTQVYNLQGLVKRENQLTKPDKLTLYAVSFLTKGRFGIKDERKNTLFTLMHEIAHIKGEYSEPKADKWAVKNIDKLWDKMIKE